MLRPCKWNLNTVLDETGWDDRNFKHDGFRGQWSAVRSYLSEKNNSFNDVDFRRNIALENLMLENNIPPCQARHFAHIFTADPLVLYEDRVYMDDEVDQTLFENINSCVWESLRFKPPVLGSQCFWRVEFRPMSVQPTEFENAAFALFIVVLSRAILKFCNFYWLGHTIFSGTILIW